MRKLFTAIVFVLIASSITSCNKDIEKGEAQQSSKRQDNFCSTQKDPDLIMKVRFDTPSMTKEEMTDILAKDIERYVQQGKFYMKVSVTSGEITTSFYKFNDSRADLRKSNQAPKVLNTDKELRTIGSGTATAVAGALSQLKWNIANHPYMYSPCETELEIFEWDGVYYLEDCC